MARYGTAATMAPRYGNRGYDGAVWNRGYDGAVWEPRLRRGMGARESRTRRSPQVSP